MEVPWRPLWGKGPRMLWWRSEPLERERRLGRRPSPHPLPKRTLDAVALESSSFTLSSGTGVGSLRSLGSLSHWDSIAR